VSRTRQFAFASGAGFSVAGFTVGIPSRHTANAILRQAGLPKTFCMQPCLGQDGFASLRSQ
jgi:hypothetical protein